MTNFCYDMQQNIWDISKKKKQNKMKRKHQLKIPTNFHSYDYGEWGGKLSHHINVFVLRNCEHAILFLFRFYFILH